MAQKTVLIGEDEEDMQALLEDILMRSGFDTTSAGNGEDVLVELHKKPPDVVLLDIRMPKCDGLKTLEKMRMMNLSIPVVIVTAYGDISSAVQAMRLGAVDYITKPFNNDCVVESVHKALENDSVSREISTIREVQISTISKINVENASLRRELETLRNEKLKRLVDFLKKPLDVEKIKVLTREDHQFSL